MTIAADLTQALECAPPIANGHRRWIIAGESAGPALGAEMAAKGNWTPPSPDKLRRWTERVPPRLWGIAIVPTDQFPGWLIVDRPRSALDPYAVAES